MRRCLPLPSLDSQKGPTMSDPDVPIGSDQLRDRLVLAAVNALTDGDPLLMIGVGDNEIRLGWAHE
jgi:hypothetical protein